MSKGTMWTGGAGTADWQNPSNWSAGVPVDGDTVYIFDPANVTLSNSVVTNETIYLVGYGAYGPGLTMNNSQLGGGTSLLVGGQSRPMSLIANGYNSNFGTIYVYQDSLDMQVTPGGFFAQYGNMAAWGSDTQAPILQINISSTAGFQNLNFMDSGSRGTIDINFGGSSYDGQVIFNTGIIDASTGGGIVVNSVHDSVGTTSYGLLVNNNWLLSDGGWLTLNSDVVQDSNSLIEARNGGTVEIDGAVTGGTVKIDSPSLGLESHLRFGLPAADASHIPLAGSELQSNLDLEGAAIISFANTRVASWEFNPYADTLRVVGFGADGNMHQVGNFHLVGPTAYTADMFTRTPGADLQFADPSHLS